MLEQAGLGLEGLAPLRLARALAALLLLSTPTRANNEGCTTVDNVPCVFPFEYQSVTYESCTSVDGGTDDGAPIFWCSTSTTGLFDGMAWGNCDPANCFLPSATAAPTSVSAPSSVPPSTLVQLS